jgi:hypothetical protein
MNLRQLSLLSATAFAVVLGYFVAAGRAVAADGDGARPVEQLVSEAKAGFSTIEQTSQAVGNQLIDAHKKRDAVKEVCLSDVVDQLGVTKQTASDRLESIQAAASAGNRERVESDHAVMGELVGRSNELSAQANGCIGKDQGILSKAELKVTVDPTIPGTDTASRPPRTSASVAPTTVELQEPPRSTSPVR